MKYCIEMLQKIPMSLEFAILFLEHPSSVLTSEVVQPLLDSVKRYLEERYKDLNKSPKEAMALPLSAVEVILSSDGLKVDSEEDVFDFILNWALVHYPKFEERQEILTKRLAQFICFPYMGCSKLKNVLVHPDFDHEELSKLVVNALFSKIEDPYGHHIITPSKCSSPRRDYKYRHVKVVQFGSPWPRCVVYFDLKKEECQDLVYSREIWTRSFVLCGRWCFLSVVYSAACPSSLILVLHKGYDQEPCTVVFKVEMMKKTTLGDFHIQSLGNCTFDKAERVCIMKELWSYFSNDNGDFYINGFLHFRVELAIKNSQA